MQDHRIAPTPHRADTASRRSCHRYADGCGAYRGAYCTHRCHLRYSDEVAGAPGAPQQSVFKTAEVLQVGPADSQSAALRSVEKDLGVGVTGPAELENLRSQAEWREREPPSRGARVQREP